MTSWLEILALACSALLLLPVLVLVTESLAALRPPRGAPAGRAPNTRCAVLVPAHDEEACIRTTLASVVPQLRPGDRLLVVADNCADRTAEFARSAGAAVVERVDPDRRGKGFALDFGVRALEPDPPDVVVVVDADCLVRPGGIDLLVGEADRTGRPVQAVYLLDPPPGAGVRAQVSGFAFRFKNQVRPLGLDRLGLPCLLTGSGMAFPWEVLRGARLASANITEDMRLGLDLACAGHPPKLCARAGVHSVLPSGRQAAYRQRTRWEHGHMGTLLTQAPRLLVAAVRQRRLDLLGLALELSVPPLSVLGLLYAAAAAAAGLLWSAAGAPLPAALLACGGLAAAGALLASWARFGRKSLPFTSLLAAPLYALGKVPIYLAFVLRPQRAWARTARDRPAPQGGGIGG
jgi:cellulose synthase/poly-beta-1,6-N-acetylglucosamine synthase-like glycosyltransferase